MKKDVLISCLLVLTTANMLSPQSEFPKFTGPYLGQKPPGITPEIFAPGRVSKEGDQAKLNLSPDLSEIIYWERKPPDNLNTIVRIIRDGEQWKAPEILPFSKDFINNEPSLSPDGSKLFFVSNRPRKIGGEPEQTPDIWFVEKVEGTWGAPINMGAPINTDGVEVQPFMSAEPCFYFCRPPAEVYCSAWSGGNGGLSESAHKQIWSRFFIPLDTLALFRTRTGYLSGRPKRPNG